MKNIKEDKPKSNLYEFRGEQFMSDEDTVAQKNYALALNGSKDRYVKVKKPRRNSKVSD